MTRRMKPSDGKSTRQFVLQMPIVVREFVEKRAIEQGKAMAQVVLDPLRREMERFYQEARIRAQKESLIQKLNNSNAEGLASLTNQLNTGNM